MSTVMTIVGGRALRRLALCCVLAGLAVAPSSAHAGTYYVHACYSDGAVDGWERMRSVHSDAYIACPEGGANQGILARNVVNNQFATPLTGAHMSVRSPAGTYFDHISFDAFLIKNLNWHAGITDIQNSRWAWCGAICDTSWIWQRHEVGLASNHIGAMVACAPGCGRSTQILGSISIRNVTLRVQDTWDPTLNVRGGSLLSGGWLRGTHQLEAGASDNVGIRSIRLAVDGAQHDIGEQRCHDRLLIPCGLTASYLLSADLSRVSDGVHTVDVSATDAGGAAVTSSFSVRVDNNPPGPVEDLRTAEPFWLRKNSFNASWTNPAYGVAAPIAGVRYQFCKGATQAASDCAQAEYVSGAGIESLEDLQMPSPGLWRLRLWAVDAAGNEDPSTAREVEVRWDSTPPSIRMPARNAEDPTRIVVQTSDLVSGVAATEIEVRREGDSTWHSLPTTSTADGFFAIIDDETYPQGRYEIRARARDHAGNEESVQGEPLTLPVRLATELAVGRSKKVRAHGTGPGRFRRVLVAKPRADFGRTIKLTGRLVSPGGNPLAARDVEVSELRQIAGAAWRPIATVRTDDRGRFVFKALPGPNRLLRFRYGGTPTIRGQTSVVEMHVRASSTLTATRSKVLNGEEVVFKGIVLGEPIPESGKLLQLQVYSRGSWLTFATPRADPRGRWTHPYRFTATRGVTRYRFRVRVPRESGYPFEAGRSRVVRVKVLGL